MQASKPAEIIGGKAGLPSSIGRQKQPLIITKPPQPAAATAASRSFWACLVCLAICSVLPGVAWVAVTPRDRSSPHHALERPHDPCLSCCALPVVLPPSAATAVAAESGVSSVRVVAVAITRITRARAVAPLLS